MQRQRGELVPIGEALGDLDGPVKAIRDASPQALYHRGCRTRLMALFAGDPLTQADQVTPTGELDCAWSRVPATGTTVMDYLGRAKERRLFIFVNDVNLFSEQSSQRSQCQERVKIWSVSMRSQKWRADQGRP